MAGCENWNLKHVADVIHEEENQQSWSEMQSVRVFERGTQESGQQAPVQSSPVRADRWPAKKAMYSHNMSYVRASAALPPRAVRAAAAQAAAAVPTTKVLADLCWGCGKVTHRRAECTTLTHVCRGCKRVGHLEAVCSQLQPHLAPKCFMDKLARGDAVSQPSPQGCHPDDLTYDML